MEKRDTPAGRYYGDYPSVTTVLGIVDKPLLIPWATKKCAEYVAAHWEAGKAYDQPTIDATLKAAKNRHKWLKDEAADLGTKAHDLVERISKGQDVQTDGMDERIQNAVKAYREWWAEQTLVPVVTERRVASSAHGYAGTLDGVFEDPHGRLLLVDYKTSNAVYETYLLQVAAYAYGYAEQEGAEIDGAVIVRIGKAAGPPEIRPITRDELPEMFDAFLAALKLWRWVKAHKV